MQTTVFQHKAALSNSIKLLQDQNKTIGFVPTMGALHNGHLALIKKALSENNYVVCSIFVNPTQFDNSEDLEKYPNTLEEDLSLLNEIGCHAAFVPQVKEMYPEETKSINYSFEGIENEMEGAFRPGHFDGVATIVSKLFEAVHPNNAYFGEKDFQQYLIVKSLAKQFYPTVNIIGCEIIREPNGLAMSSRNTRLSPKGFKDSAEIYKALQNAQEKAKAGLSPDDIESSTVDFIQKNPNMKVEYITIVDCETLKKVIIFDNNRKFRIFAACWIDGVRLIDNIPLYPKTN